jgi:hypothetical protein
MAVAEEIISQPWRAPRTIAAAGHDVRNTFLGDADSLLSGASLNAPRPAISSITPNHEPLASIEGNDHRLRAMVVS